MKKLKKQKGKEADVRAAERAAAAEASLKKPFAVVVWDGKPAGFSLPDRNAQLAAKVDPQLNHRTFVPIFKSVRQYFFDNPRLTSQVRPSPF